MWARASLPMRLTYHNRTGAKKAVATGTFLLVLAEQVSANLLKIIRECPALIAELLPDTRKAISHEESASAKSRTWQPWCDMVASRHVHSHH